MLYNIVTISLKQKIDSVLIVIILILIKNVDCMTSCKSSL